MKKFLAVLMVLCFATSGFAAWWTNKSDTKTPPDAKTTADTTKTTDKNATKQKEPVIVTMAGKVTSINPPQNELVISDSKTGNSKVFVVDPDVYKTVNIGDTVEAKFKADTNTIDSIKVVKAAKAETKPVQPKAKPTKK